MKAYGGPKHVPLVLADCGDPGSALLILTEECLRYRLGIEPDLTAAPVCMNAGHFEAECAADVGGSFFRVGVNPGTQQIVEIRRGATWWNVCGVIVTWLPRMGNLKRMRATVGPFNTSNPLLVSDIA